MATTRKVSRKPSRRPPKAAQQPFTLVYFIVCDEVRFEARTEKAIHIGVYTGAIILRDEGVPLDRLSFVFCIDRKGSEQPEQVEMSLISPDGSTLGTMSFRPEPQDALRTSTTLVAETRGLKFVAGGYRVRLTVNGAHTLDGSFEVRVQPERFAAIQAPNQSAG